MNYADYLIELIQVYPCKNYGKDLVFDWCAGEIKRNDLLARFDTELLVETNLAIQEFEPSTDYLLTVGSRFGTMVVLDKSDLLVPITSYYIKSGLMYGPVKPKKKQFAFELTALANKNGIFFTEEIGKRENTGETSEIFELVKKILSSYYKK